MLHARAFALCMALFALAMVRVGAAGKVTVDPNAPGLSPTQTVGGDFWNADPRLGQKITLSARRKTVSSIIDDLSRLSGVKLHAGSGGSDWHTRDLKMNVFVKDLPTKDLMRSIARVMKFKWMREGDKDAWTYRVVREKDTRAEERRQEEFDRERAERRKRLFSELADTGHMSPEETAKLKDSKPYLYEYARESFGVSLGKLLAESPALMDALTSGRYARLTSSDLPSDAGMMVIEANRTLEEGTDGLCGPTLADLKLQCGRGTICTIITDPYSESAKAFAQATKEEDGTQQSSGGMRAVPIDSKTRDIMIAEQKRDKLSEPFVEHADEPFLHTKLKMDVKDERPDTSIIQRALAEAGELGVVSDNYGGLEPNVYVPKGESQLKDLLAELTPESGRNWWKNGSVLEFRDRKWYVKRKLMIPEATLDVWRRALKKNGYLPLDCLAQMAALSRMQIMANPISDDDNLEFSTYAVTDANRDLLRFYSNLDGDQRSAMASPKGLNLRGLPSEQWRLVEKMADSHWVKLPEGELGLTETETSRGKTVTYRFVIAGPNGPLAPRWELDAPQPRPRPKDK